MVSNCTAHRQNDILPQFKTGCFRSREVSFNDMRR